MAEQSGAKHTDQLMKLRHPPSASVVSARVVGGLPTESDLAQHVAHLAADVGPKPEPTTTQHPPQHPPRHDGPAPGKGPSRGTNATGTHPGILLATGSNIVSASSHRLSFIDSSHRCASSDWLPRTRRVQETVEMRGFSQARVATPISVTRGGAQHAVSGSHVTPAPAPSCRQLL
ncbi:hypothetical protein C0Q70_21153 [Pomacea canaliculata]|uniref:Uncharacterized protein n=1 Tax=Pomacea canaliculata TaxID=400727 RepID=A0A2T7NBQ7_POMCA|nr:hypothetical protein C0Q70_21153 [Pomacea canaliculata]